MSYCEFRCKIIKKTLKDHYCEWCAECIEKGSSAQQRAYIFDGDFKSGYMHLECVEAIKMADKDDIIDGWQPGDFKRGTTESIYYK